MPLLRRQPFTRSDDYRQLPDHAEVFYCEITDEVFHDYEEYCERIILVNSMVWCCEMTGVPNLTYAEALESERKAQKLLRGFPMELRVPVLYLASKTKRCAFVKMSDDIYFFVRDRYFVGETVEACVNGDAWAEAHVLSVIASKNSTPSMLGVKDPSAYKYEVELFEEDESESTQNSLIIVSHDKVRRKRGVFTRIKNQLYLKQFMELGPAGILQLKESVVEKYNINKVKFDQIFVGNPPDFPSSKKFTKIIDDMLKNKTVKRNSLEKKSKQETIAKYMTKSDKFDSPKQLNTSENRFSNNHKAHNDSFLNSSMKNKMIKRSKKEKRVMFAAYMKEWNKIKDDLELEDHKPLPKTVAVEITGIPNKYFGDFMGILEFFLEFSKPIKVKNYFSNGIDIETLRRALTAREVAGPLCDIIQMLLCTIFNLQEEEAEEYNDRKLNYGTHLLEDDAENSGEMTVFRGTQLATVAAKWSQTYLSTPLQKLPMDSQTFSEILRLHLLSSGSNVGENCAKWRYQQRGGYNAQDDPGLLFKLKNPHVLKALSTKHITQLPLTYKIKLINCLISQILTYSTIRDIIEENQEKSRDIKTKIKSLQSAERKREAEFTLARQKIKKDAAAKKENEKLTGDKAKAIDEQVFKSIEDLKKESLAKRLEFEKKYKEFHSHSFAFQSCLGTDRAFRRYWMYESVEGLFVEHAEELSGRCLDKPVFPNPLLASAPPEDALTYVQKMFECELNGGNSDKENDSQNTSPRKSIGTSQSSGESLDVSVNSKVSLMQDLLMCTADSSNCPVHSSSYKKTRWSFFEASTNVDELLIALNKRGVRENDLRQLLEQEKDQVSKYISNCPKNLLNPVQFPVVGRLEVQTRLVRKYVDANLRYPPETDTNTVLEMVLRDALLDIEEKIYHGALGELKINDRNIWRDAISNRSYDQQCSEFVWGPEKVKPDDSVVYRDPGVFLAGPEEINSDVEAEILEDSNDADTSSVHSLACALLQIEQAVVHKHLKRPLGYDQKELNKDNNKINLNYDALKKWEISLMGSNSFAQVSLHLFVLENSIEWSRSILNANCRICRKKNDDENMLLCDNCNKGYHMYCLKPKLTKVPKGDWFCNNCKPREKTPPKKRNRKIFKEEESADESDDDSSTSSNTGLRLCVTCRSGGSLIQCSECSKSWHQECLPQPLQRKNLFTCTQCSKQSNQDKDWDPKIRRCAADAINNIDHYKKMLKQQHMSDSESGDEPLISKARKKVVQNGTHLESNNRAARNVRSRRSAPESYNGFDNSENSDDSNLPVKSKEIINGNGIRKSTRSLDTKRNSLPLISNYTNGVARKTRRSEAIHQTILEDLINEVMNHKDSWPFNAPVTVEEVPDYFEIITEPMDFGTIKRKLQNGKYSSDTDFVNDVLLVFNNCYRYNHDEDIVAKAGIRLQKFFEKRCKDLNLTDLLIEDNTPQAKRLKISD